MMTMQMNAAAFVNAQGSSLEDWGLEADDTVEVTSEGLVSVTSRDIDRDLEVPHSQRASLARTFFGSLLDD